MSRAEEVRRRRTNRASRRVVQAQPRRGSKSREARTPPVLVRGRINGVPLYASKRGKRPRRRFDVALGATGAEVRLPSLPVISIGWRLLSGVLAPLLAFCLYTLWNSPTYRVQAAEVEGLVRLSSEEVNSVARVAGEPVFAVKPDEVAASLRAAFPEFSKISVDVGLPARVVVTVEERRPVLAWRQQDREVWVDAYGVAFPARGENGPPVLVEANSAPPQPVFENPGDMEDVSTRFMAPDLVTAVLALSVHAPEGVSLVYTPERGLGWRDTRGWDVYFGKYNDDIQMKLRVYEALVQHLSDQGIRPALVSVEYVHAPYYRLEH